MLEQCITSFLEGRVRLRHERLRDAALAMKIEQLLPSLPGVEGVEVNTVAGSLLLRYDPAVLGRDDLLALLRRGEQWLGLHDAAPAPAPGTTGRRWKKKVCNRLMLASLGICLALGLTGPGRAHRAAGYLCAAFSAGHVWRRRHLL